ncbi:MAG: hypothetical protein ABIN48_14205 [Ginsengibacter sp.]
MSQIYRASTAFPLCKFNAVGTQWSTISSAGEPKKPGEGRIDQREVRIFEMEDV